jgi:spore coat protein CotH
MSRPRPILFTLLLAVAASACSNGSDRAQADGDGTGSQAGEAIFDSAVVHEIEVSFDEDDYDEMIATFSGTGQKTWIEATVTIDGTTYERVGMRLKGNSSLAGLGGGIGGRRPGPTTETTTAAGEESTTTTTPPADQEGASGGGGRFGSASAENPEDLPWLIRLDEFVEGQDHQGYEDIVVRSNGSETSLNEAVALDLLAEAGLASQEAAATSFSVNGGDSVLRLAIEHPDDDAWQEASFDGDGALYKAESTGDWSYRGDDEAAYEEIWDQEGGSDTTDLAPLIEFLQFLNESDGATFAAELPERLDVEGFARYLAMMELVANFDDIDGPGNNAYLWYDVATEQFTVVAWDLNLAFGGFGAGGGPGAGGPPEGFELPEGVEPPEGFDPTQLPEGFDPSQLPEGVELPEGFDPTQLPEGVERGRGPGGGGPGGFGRSNVLVERFHANAEFEALYQQQLVDLREALYGSDVAADVLASWVDTLTEEAAALVDGATVTDEAEAISEQFTAT